MFAVLGMLTEATLSLGIFTLHQMLLTASFRKHQSARVYLIDHPNPPPRPLHLGVEQDLLVDAPAIKGEFLREYYRVAWWAFFHTDVLAALLFGHKPLVDLNDCFVNFPQAGEDLEARLDAELLSTASLDIHHGRMYPTFLSNGRIKHNGLVIKAEIAILDHRIAQLRSRQATDPAAWVRALPGLNYELDRWHSQLVEPSHRVKDTTTTTTSNEDSLVLKDTISASFQAQVMCIVLVLFLNHFDGHSPTTSTEPFPGSALREALRATTGDITDRTLGECHERCWHYITRLRSLVIDSIFPPAIIFNTLFLTALYPAAVICHERAYGMGVVYPTPVESADRQLADRFMDEIMHALGTFGELWQANLKIVDEIRQIPAEFSPAKTNGPSPLAEDSTAGDLAIQKPRPWTMNNPSIINDGRSL
ncbi:hypothetical protein BJ085DRAFT_34752 [Dimargaris cristalligena]|uniref:Transcription factor domain-containing protein n=1 Tax=Dimargaris cristalligena TaxID=215637 RepID=A0A4P9ZM29_9FUNG|nr:hypothetical protein BJ085DRAFT_34752 [Dimargaris cristalligena]|eukprot:RKP33571.1 hypothetical protein BJ085DRAFT_34752 [Dimargaris cristalligena]